MKPMLPTQELEDLIIEVRGMKVMLDSDLATLYAAETKPPSRANVPFYLWFAYPP